MKITWNADARLGLQIIGITLAAILLLLLFAGCQEGTLSQLIKPGVAYADCANGIDPVVTLEASRTEWKAGDTGTYTISVSVPENEPAPSKDTVMHWTLPTPLTPVSVKLQLISEPITVTNAATGEYVSNTAEVNWDGAAPVDKVYTQPLGDIPVGGSIKVIIEARL